MDECSSVEDGQHQQSDRLQILSPEEYEQLWGLPCFTQADRDLFFVFTEQEMPYVESLRTLRSKIYFVLQLGYFRARQRFFRFKIEAVQDDVHYLRRRYFGNTSLPDVEVSEHTRQRHVQKILDIFGYHLCAEAERTKLEEIAIRAARISSKPVFVLRELVDHLRQQRIVLPGYTFLQDVVRGALGFERNRLIDALSGLIGKIENERLDELLKDSDGLHAITLLKREPRDFSHQQLLTEIARGKRIRPLFSLAQRITLRLDISAESIRYYASLVDYYTVYKLKRMAVEVAQLYLLCFLYDRYQRLNDNLLTALCSLVNRYAGEASLSAKAMVYHYKIQTNDDVKNGAKILELFRDPEIAGDLPFSEVRQRAYRLLTPDRLARLCQHLVDELSIDETLYEWEEIDLLMPRAKKNIRPLLRFVELDGAPSNADVLKMLHIMKKAFADGKQLPIGELSVSLIPVRLKPYLIDEDARIIRDRYEFWIYRTLRERLDAGDVYCCNSARFRSFEDDLIDDTRFQNRENLMRQLELNIARQPIREHLDLLRETLEERIKTVNRRIQAGENPFVRLRNGHLDWSRAVRGQEQPKHEPFFDLIRHLNIDTLLRFVDQRTGFMKAFEHVLGRYQKTSVSEPTIIACLMSYATNIGLGRMAEISDLSYQELSTTANNFIRLETLKEANDKISNETAKLPIFRHFDIDDVVHSSSDGQKFETGIHTFNARHSSKYFGLRKGVAAYTLLANHVPLNAQIIGANEHESHYVFDIVFNNSTDIVPEIHSTDTHGTNEVNFALLYLFDYQFAPRYKDLKSKLKTNLYGFQHPSQYGDHPIKPIRKIKEDLIISEWPNIERILLSLALKTTTQSIIVGKLSSYPRKNKTKLALWEFDNIIKSIYLLDYIDSPALRRNVQRALNRGEAYHQLRRAIAYAHGGRFRVRSQHEQELWNACSRLVANAVIYYNSLVLSEALDELEKRGEIATAELLKRISPVAWQHINFYGRYEFHSDFEPINISEIREQLSSCDIAGLYAT
ncbi:MAG: Tn3 family transposase [bacterium]|nr:Tn3 family transposase [bacterium]